MKLLQLFTKKVKTPIYIKSSWNHMLEGRRALITGGGSGIGLEIAREFAKEGCNVVISGRNEEKLKNAVASIPGASYLVLNVTNINETEAKIKELFSFFAIDILVNSAGIHYSESFLNVSESEFDRIMNTNLKGTYFVTQCVAKMMISNSIRGNILMISSSSAKRPAWGPYHLSKWCIDGMIKGFADKLIQYGIVVNGIAPGQTLTDMTIGDKNNLENESVMLDRFILPEEISATASFLVSDFARNIVGDVVYISGGSGLVNSHR